MRVYKFLESKWALENIKKKRLKISILDTLNDPWDHRGVQFCDPQYRLAWEEMLSGMGQTSGIICFSKNWTNPVIWSHYAKNHEGIVLGFDVEAIDSAGEPLFLDVQYPETPIKFCGFDEPSEDFIKRVIATKFESWSYEDEVRYFASLTDPDPDNGHFFMEFGPGLVLREIIFGVRYRNPEEMAAILSIARKDPNVDCWRATLGNTDFHLIKDPTWKYVR